MLFDLSRLSLLDLLLSSSSFWITTGTFLTFKQDFVGVTFLCDNTGLISF